MQGYQDLKDELADPDFVPIMVLLENLDGDPPTTADAAYTQEHLGLDFSVTIDPDGAWTETWNPEQAFPQGTLIDRNGQVVWAETGGGDATEEEVRAAVIAALGD